MKNKSFDGISYFIMSCGFIGVEFLILALLDLIKLSYINTFVYILKIVLSIIILMMYIIFTKDNIKELKSLTFINYPLTLIVILVLSFFTALAINPFLPYIFFHIFPFIPYVLGGLFILGLIDTFKK